MPSHTFLLAALILCIPILSSAQHHVSPGESNSNRQAVLTKGIGEQRHAVTTKNSRAQEFFDQGLAFVYAFNHEEAALSFHKAAELDPAMAMAYWGIALALGPNYNIPVIDAASMKKAHGAIQKAISLSGPASPGERDYIQALAQRFSDAPQADSSRLNLEYSRAMKHVYRNHPEDPDAAVLYVESLMDLRPWRLWNSDGTAAEGTPELVTVLESILKRFPNHLGANHFYIHVMEASPFPDRALASARKIAALAPAAGHIVHMPSHIYMRTGQYMDAVKSNRDAIAVDRKYMAERGSQGTYPFMYFSHNLHFLAAGCMMLGEYADSLKSANELRDHVLPYAREYQSLQAQTALPLLVQVRFGRWNDVLNTPKPPGDLPIEVAFWRFARGMAHAATGKLTDAREDLRLTSMFVSAAPPDSSIGMNRTADILRINTYILAGRIEAAAGNPAEAVNFFRQAVAAQDRLNYDEPSNYFYPVRESLGAALLQSGDAPSAELVFREDLKKNPKNARSLFGLAQALQLQKKNTAAQALKEYKDAWRHADTDLRLEDF